MKSRILMSFVFVAAILFLATGCVKMKTYTVVKDRVDQQLSSGNRGYLMGSSGDEGMQDERRMTRKTYVAEVEVWKPSELKESKNMEKNQKQQELSDISDDEGYSDTFTQEEEVVFEPVVPVVSTYTVKKNDTLQKISLEVFGTTKKWNKIYEANSDRLKSPDKIYAGQVLKIPQE